MIYQSTRDDRHTADSVTAVLKGIADDGGLYMIRDFGALDLDYRELMGKPTMEMARILLHALLDDFTEAEMAEMVDKAYRGKFETDELTPTVPVGDRFVCELFRGPTCAFKDVALSMLPQLLTTARKKAGKQDDTLILTATSGDTGKAALEGFRDVPGIRILVFYPNGGVSAVQKAQMVTQKGKNVCVCAVNGNFDDAQTGVKNTFAAFSKMGKADRLSSANSINIGRLAPQTVYYFKAYSDLLSRGEIREGEPVDFVVPTGNFGDILAGYFAKCMGLPVGRLVCASNRNCVLTDFLATGKYDRCRPFYKTDSPSMDILVSSNLERLLFLLSGDAAEVAGYMKDLNEKGAYQITPSLLAKIRETFVGGFCDDAETLQTIRRVYETTGYLCDTHTAVAFAVSEKLPGENKTVILSTASPYKFPAAVWSALGHEPMSDEFAVMKALEKETGLPIPKGLRDLQNLPVLHRDVIEKQDMTDYVLRKAEETSWQA